MSLLDTTFAVEVDGALLGRVLAAIGDGTENGVPYEDFAELLAVWAAARDGASS